MRKNISTHTPSESRVGYSRAVIVNNRMYISGTTAVNIEGAAMGNTLYEQTVFIFDRITKVLEQEGFANKDVVALTVYVTYMSKLPEFDKAFKERFFDIKPTCTLVGIKELQSPSLCVEVAAIAEKAT
jgi:enamine deaminase RidA (YjgF/YER057c/UK114 family)